MLTMFCLMLWNMCRSSEESKVMFPTVGENTALLWTKRVVIGLALAVLIAFRFLPPQVTVWIALAISLEIAMFLHMGFGSTFDQFISTVVFCACLGYALLAIYIWPLAIVVFGILFCVAINMERILRNIVGVLDRKLAAAKARQQQD